MCTRKGRVVFPRFPLLTTHQPLFFALCFHIVTNPFSRHPFRFTSIQNPGGGGYSVLYLATRHSPLATSPLFSSSCGLFGSPKTVTSLAIDTCRSPFRTHPGS